jgi:hypothetical protein
MPTSYDITQAISLGKTIADYLTSAMIDKYAVGDTKQADEHARNACFIRSQVAVLEFYQLNGADTELTADQLSAVIYNIHEYDYAQLLDIEDFAVQVGSESDALGAGEAVVVLKSGAIIPTAQSYTWLVIDDGDDTFQVPFEVSQVDTDSITLTLNDADPIFDDSYTIVGTTLTWTGEYPLSAGWKFEIKWWGQPYAMPS